MSTLPSAANLFNANNSAQNHESKPAKSSQNLPVNSNKQSNISSNNNNSHNFNGKDEKQKSNYN